MNSTQATSLIVAGLLQFAAVAARFFPVPLLSNGWVMVLAIILLTAILYGIATLLQRLLLPGNRPGFALGVLWSSIVVSLTNSITSLVSAS